MPRVTESLRREWQNSQQQQRDERLVTQDGTPRDADSILVDLDLEVTDELLKLPLGATFDARDVARQVRARHGL